MSINTFLSQYTSVCNDCNEVIYPDDECIYNSANNVVHAKCDPADTFDKVMAREICTGCFTELPVNGVCSFCD